MRLFSALALTALLSTPLAAQGNASVSIVHGIPGVTVDVYVNGDLTLPGFEPGAVAGPLELPADSYRVQVVLAGETDLSSAVLDETLDVPAGSSLSVVAHLDASGAPALSVFVNDLSDPGSARGRVTVRHVAAAPDVNVLLVKRWRPVALLRNLENGDQGSADLAAGEYSAYVLASGKWAKVAGPIPVSLAEGTNTIVYAVGSLAAGTFGVVAQVLPTTLPPAHVTVVHGVPGLTVDVFVNGNLFLPGFEPKTITEPVELPAGLYSIAIAPEGAGIDAAVIRADVEVTPGLDASVVAHLAPDGSPTASVFVDDLSSPSPGKGRVVVRHTAAAPEVDVRLLRPYRPAAVLAAIANGGEAAAEARAGRYQASVSPAGGDAVVLGPAALTVRPWTVTTVYAIGSLADGSLELIRQVRLAPWKRAIHAWLGR